MKFTKNFTELNKDSVSIAGGKGASLGEMVQAGFPVPPGFVILAQSFDHFVEGLGLSDKIKFELSKVDLKNTKVISAISENIRKQIANAEVPAYMQTEIENQYKKLGAKFVAVRSSATSEDSSSASWAGELESYLNVSDGNLMEYVKKSWSSLFTTRAIFYRYQKGLDKNHVGVAVVVQKMVQSEISGVTFTVHPGTEDYNQMVIEAGYGLGETIVGGLVTPDNYVINKSDIAIVEKDISEQSIMMTSDSIGTREMNVPKKIREDQKINDNKIIELAKICLKIEEHYKSPCDIEWAFENKQFLLVQSRPITTLAKKVKIFGKLTKEQKTAKKIRNFIKLKEIDVQSAMASIFNVSVCYGAFMTSENIHKKELPHIYFYMKDKYFTQISSIEELKRMTTVYYHDAIKGGKSFKVFLKRQDAIMKNFLSKKISSNISIEEGLEVINYLSKWWQLGLIGEDKGMAIENDLINIFSKKEKSKKDIESMVSIFSTPENPSIFIKERIIFYKLCIRFLKKENIDKYIKKYIRDYFYIETNFYDYRVMTTDSVKEKIKSEVNDRNINYFQNEIKNIAKNSREIINERKRVLKNLSLSKNDKYKLEFLHDFSEWLNIRKENMMKTFYFFSQVLHNISDVTKIPFENLTYYTYREVKKLILEDQTLQDEEVGKRRNGCFAELNKEGINFVYGDEAENLFFLARATKNDSEIKGKTAFGNGVIKGKARIIKDPVNEIFNEGDILVTSMTRIEFVPLMKKARAIITDEGGISCHAAIVSRELKVPCVTGTKNATKIIKNNDVIIIDTDGGSVVVYK